MLIVDTENLILIHVCRIDLWTFPVGLTHAGAFLQRLSCFSFIRWLLLSSSFSSPPFAHPFFFLWFRPFASNHRICFDIRSAGNFIVGTRNEPTFRMNNFAAKKDFRGRRKFHVKDYEIKERHACRCLMCLWDMPRSNIWLTIRFVPKSNIVNSITVYRADPNRPTNRPTESGQPRCTMMDKHRRRLSKLKYFTKSNLIKRLITGLMSIGLANFEPPNGNSFRRLHATWPFKSFDRKLMTVSA